jgi:formylmethanofuran dehydrogenase subunit D
MAEKMTLIAGRSSKQGVSLNVGKLGAEYLEASTTLEMNANDMARLGLKDGDSVQLRTATGETVVRCKGRKAEELPGGILFLAYGPASSQLMGGDTAGTGMPISKNFDVEVEPLN